jgi:hypothetical protein
MLGPNALYTPFWTIQKCTIKNVVRHLSNGKLTKLHLAERGDVFNVLISLSSGENVRVKREAISTILGLALVIENQVLLMRHSEGAVSSTLARILKNEMDYIVQRRAARALRCMACADTVDFFCWVKP